MTTDNEDEEGEEEKKEGEGEAVGFAALLCLAWLKTRLMVLRRAIAE